MGKQTAGDADTKGRLLEAAGAVFARRGFRAATVREICRCANANVGAINYHFRDKEGLYLDVLEYAHQMAVRKYPPDGGLDKDASAEERLRAFIKSFLMRILGDGLPAWHGKLMAREVAEPTTALETVIESSIRPLFSLLLSIVQELLGQEQDSMTAQLCAMSIVGQCLHYFHARRVVSSLCRRELGIAEVDRLAEHIMQFSVGGIRQIQHKQV